MAEPFRILACGGRDYATRNRKEVLRVIRTLEDQRLIHGEFQLIEGGASGADTAAWFWAMSAGMPTPVTYMADWEQFPRSAGVLRNTRMLVEGKPDLVIAFSGGPGTADMIRQARKAGVEVMEIQS